MEEGGGAFGEAFFEVGDVAVVAAVELDVGRGCEALGMEGDLVLRAEGVEVGADGEEVVRGFDRGEAGAGNDEGGGVLKAGNGRAHGGFQLDNGGGVGADGVHGFCVDDEGELGKAVVGAQHVGEGFQIQP